MQRNLSSSPLSLCRIKYKEVEPNNQTEILLDSSIGAAIESKKRNVECLLWASIELYCVNDKDDSQRDCLTLTTYQVKIAGRFADQITIQ